MGDHTTTISRECTSNASTAKYGQGLFILSRQAALFRGDKQKAAALIVVPHIGVEVRHGAPFPGCVARAPLYEEADRETPEHSQDPYGIRCPHPAGILTGASVQPLLQSVFNAPVCPSADPPRRGRQLGLRPAGQQPNRFFLASAGLR